MADQELNVTITANDQGASAALSSNNEQITQIVASLATLTGIATENAKAISALAASHTVAAGAAKEHAAAETIFGESVGKVESATNAAARAASALGLNVAEAAERVNSFGEALDGLGKAAGPLLVVGAALLAIAEAANFVKEGIQGAADAQSYLQTLGQTVQRQGGDWDTAKEGVERFLNAIEGATQYSRDEALKALNELTSAGMSLSDAEKTVAISADVAAGTHRSLTDVVDRLKEAEAGRGMGLAELDTNLRTLIHSHADYSQILEQLTKDFRGDAAAALDTYQGKSAQLRNEIDHFAEDLGEKLLPYLEEATEVLIGLAEGAEAHVPQIEHFFDTLIQDARTALGVLNDLNAVFDAINGKDLADAVTGNNFGGDMDRLNNAVNHFTDFAGTFGGQNDWAHPPAGEHSGGIGWMSQMSQMSQLFSDAQKQAAATRANATRDFNTAENQSLQHDFPVGNTTAAGGGPTPVEPITDDAVDKVQDYEVALKALDAYIKTITDSEKALSEAVKLATNEHDKDNAEMALAAKVTSDAQREVALYTGFIANEKDELATANAAHAQAQVAMDKSREAYNSYGKALGEGTKRSEEERASLEKLKAEHDQAKQKFEESQRAIDGLTSAIDKNQAALDAAKDKTHALAEAHAALILAYNDGIAANQRKTDDEIATYGRSLEQQRAYWASRIAADHAGYADGSLGAKQYYDQLLKDQNAYQDTSVKIDESDAELAKKRADLTRQVQDEAATYDLSIQQQIRYYAERYALLIQGDSAARDEAEKYYEELVKLEEDAYKERTDAEKKFVEDAESQETTLLNDLIEKHKSFHAELHDIFKQVGDDFIAMVERMLVEEPLLTGLEKSLFSLLNPTSGGGPGGGFGPFGNPGLPTGAMSLGSGGNLGSAVAQYGMLGAAVGQSGASSTLGLFDTSSFASFAIGSSGAQEIAQNEADAAAQGPATFDPNNLLNIGGQTTTYGSGASGLSTYAGAAVQGAAIGSTVGSALGENEQNASIGGTLGSIAGEAIGSLGGAAGGPLGSMIGSVLGSVIGGLFGSHATAATSPDIFNTQAYGQDIADLRGGQAGANGQSFFPSEEVEKFIAEMGVSAGSINGAPGEGQQMRGSTGAIGSSGGVDAAEMWLSQNLSDTPQQLEEMGISPAQFASWVSQLGASPTGSGQFTQYDKNIGDVEVTGATTGGGAHTTYSQLAADLQAIISASGGSDDTGVYRMSEAYPGAPAVVSSSPLGYYNSTTGEYTPAAGSGGATLVPNTAAGSNAIGGASTLTPAQAAAGLGGSGPTVQVTVNGSVVGPGGIDTIINEIAQGLLRVNNGQVPGAQSNTRAVRYGLK